ncbi:MAG: TIGR03667 family PPOX class F420-dependent oxidoreductase [Thermomicrobiales bacterium]|nr:TIGR03667 family PPOX class F420-dependent oxidoreductase [Thermomicrobiales bacterium]
MALTIDTSTEFGQRQKARLENESVIWLTTVNGDGRPFPSPVWFFAEPDGTILIYSQPNKPKLRNIASNAAVALNFNSDAYGNDVIVFDGAAVIDESARAAIEHAEYLEKYRDGITHIGMTPESFSAEYNVAIRVVLQKVRGF